MTDSPPRPLPRWLRVGAWLAVAGALALVFMLYGQPDFLVMVVNQIWACF